MTRRNEKNDDRVGLVKRSEVGDCRRPLVSVIVLSYDGYRYLGECLKTVLDQDYPRDLYEVILADNASADNSLAFVRSNFPEVRVIAFDRNHGFAKGNNLAMHGASGDYIVFLNQDTIVHKSWLSGLIDGLTTWDYDACCSNMLMPRNEEFEEFERHRMPGHVYYYEINKYGYADQVKRDFTYDVIDTNFVSGGSFAIRRSVIEQLGYLFDETLITYNEDLDLSLRLKNAGFRIGISPYSIVYHLSSFSFKISKYNLWKNLWLIRNRLIVFWNNLSKKEFFLQLPYLFLSQSNKIMRRSLSIGHSFLASIILASIVMPFSVIGFLLFVKSLGQAKPRLRKTTKR